MSGYSVDRVAAVIWEASRADEGTISATGADKVAAALRSAGLVGLAEHGTAAAMRFAAVEVAMLENRTNSYSTNIAELLEADAARLDTDTAARELAEEYAAEHVVFWQGQAPGTKASIVDALVGFAREGGAS